MSEKTDSNFNQNRAQVERSCNFTNACSTIVGDFSYGYLTMVQGRAERRRTGRRPRASKAGGGPKSEMAKSKML